ncbi:type VII secretion integral membrane protein EccD [Mycobacterium sp. 21AC1]|uniref:type VII secretion integral membrane protein EccD n=1 Tax=[Mycobacterium] appelbergii TaxID=2939269 RepID=UPI002938CFA3|nr:type VII secretion integral membrane protein EccD [Mycobacterium sp. 21AC1]MDV3128476.1 type VII secretion integral membrane protein EccD [Mycobacterium sp. 21AC1]
MTDLAPTRTDLGSTRHEAVSPVPDLVRVAVVGQHRQIDLSLPLDVPVALLVPEVLRLFDGAGSEDRPKDVVWVLVGARSGAPLGPDDTLREAEIAQDDVLYLRGRRTVSAPTLYDDVVDAAAHLNQSGHPGWNPSAAGNIAYLGVGLAAAVWVYLVLIDASSPRRAAILGLSAFVVVTLFVIAAIFARSGRAPRAATALGWASLPIAAAGCWAGLSPYGPLALAGGALTLMLLCTAGYRLIGAGVGGFTAAGVFSACAAIGLVIHAAGLTHTRAGVCLAVGAAVATLAVPRLTAWLDYSRLARPEQADQQASPGTAAAPGGDDVGRRGALARALRGGLSAGLAVGACCAAATVVWGAPTPSWSTLAFGVVCAAALGLPRPVTRTGVGRAASGLPAVALLVVIAFAAVKGDEAMSVAGVSVLLVCAIVLAVVGSGSRTGSGFAQPHLRCRKLLSSASYLAFTLIAPSALWVVGAYSRWGV